MSKAAVRSRRTSITLFLRSSANHRNYFLSYISVGLSGGGTIKLLINCFIYINTAVHSHECFRLSFPSFPDIMTLTINIMIILASKVN